MNTYGPGFKSFFKGFLHYFVLAKLATRRIGVNTKEPDSSATVLQTVQ